VRRGIFKRIVEVFEREYIISNANLGLLISCKRGNIEMVKKILEIDTDINARNHEFEYGKYPIILPC